MINVTGTYNEGKWTYIHQVETIEEAIKIDYRFWCKYKVELEFIYEGEKLKRKVGEYISFDDEIDYLKEQMDKIDKIIERYKYEN